MKQWKLNACGAAVAAALSLQGLASFHRSFEPIPAELRIHAGIVSEVEVSSSRFSQARLSFRLTQPDGQALALSYLRKFSASYELAERLKNGMSVQVALGPQGNADFWGFKLGTEVLMTPEQSYNDRRSDGLWGLAWFLGLMAAALFTAREARQLRRQGL